MQELCGGDFRPLSRSARQKRTAAQSYCDFKDGHEIRIGRAVQGAMFEWHGSVEYRHKQSGVGVDYADRGTKGTTRLQVISAFPV
jgi:hypothetical protein